MWAGQHGCMYRKATLRPIALSLAVAALGVELSAGAAPVDFRIIPAGEFRSWDGRPTEVAAWVCTEEDGRRIVAELNARSSPRVIDYEHATLHAKKTGVKAPAAGWFHQAEWRADGVWLIGVDWTALAAQEIEDKAYRFVSPVFSYSPKTGRVISLLHAALVNDPALDGLTDLAALAASFFLDQPTEVSAVNEELLEQLRWLLNLPVGTTAEEVATHLSKLVTQLRGEGAAAASFDLAGYLSGQREQIAMLSAQVATPDPAKFVPVATLSALQGEHVELQGRLAALSAEIEGGKLDKIIAAGREVGKLTPATEAWARDLGKKDIAELSAFLAAAPVVVQPGKKQSDDLNPGAGGLDLNDANAVALAAQAYQGEMISKGINITTVQAVNHVSKKGA